MPHEMIPSRAPSIVGALYCQKDSYQQSLVTEVVSCIEHIADTQPESKPKGKKTRPFEVTSNGGSTAQNKSWTVEFADSVLFPEGGGQPTDHGNIAPLESPHEKVPITNVQRHGLRCIFYSPKPFAPGTRVRQEVDFARRWDHMQQHTGQHLLSAILDSLELATLSWSMGAAGDMNYVEIPRKLTDAEIKSVQDRCNKCIRDNITISIETPEEVDGAKKLPGDYDKERGVVRFIKIGNLDFNACCGTHLKTTTHIGLILLHHTQTIRGTNCRLYFSAGERAINIAADSINSIRDMAVSLSSGSSALEVKANVKRLSDSYADARKKEKKLLAEIARLESDRIKTVLSGNTAAWCYRPTDGLDFINLVVLEVKAAVKDEGVVVLASGEVKSAGAIMVVGKNGLVESMAQKVKETVSTAKGGGKGDKWQGKVSEWKKGEIEVLKAAVEGYR